jgi:plasmid stabilization system protein ParE
MTSTYKLIWSDEALNNLKSIISYLENNWTEKEISKFVRKLDHQLELIAQNPRLFPKVDNSKARKSVLSKQISIFYSIAKREINILFIHDSRKNPDMLKLS